MGSFVSVIPLYDLVGCGEVEELINFCSFVSKGERKSYHVEFLEAELMKMVRIWPVFLEHYEIFKVIRKTYNRALRRHFKEKSSGPQPRRITSWPSYTRYVTSFGAVITLSHLPSGIPVFIVQMGTEKQMFRYVGYRTMVTRIGTSRPLFPDEVLEESCFLGSISRF